MEQERELLNGFLNQLAQAHGASKDPEAEAMIAKAAAQQPDALYLLVQKAMLQEQALNSAKAQIAQLQSQLQTAKSTGGTGAGSFLGGAAWGNEPVANAGAPAPAFGRPAPVPAAAPAAMPSSGTSFLGTAAATAAGVVGGAFLFQGIESLLGHHGGGFGGGAAGGGIVENTTINNYYGADPEAEMAAADDSDFLLDSSLDGSDPGDESIWT